MTTYRSKIITFDDGLFLPVPGDVAGLLGLSEGSRVEISASETAIVLKPVQPSRLSDLFAGKTAAEWRALYRECDIEWGPDVGREIIDD